MPCMNLSNTKPGHTTGGSGQRGARQAGRSGAGQNRTPTCRVAQKTTVSLALQGILDNCSESCFGSTNKGNYLSNPKHGHTTRRSGRGGARRGGEGERGWVGRDAVESIRPADHPPSCSAANRRHCPGRVFGSMNKQNPM